MRIPLNPGVVNAQGDINPKALNDILKSIAVQVNAASEGNISGASNAYTTYPTTGIHAQGDFVRNSAPAGGSPIFGWLCTVGGEPGTWVQIPWAGAGGTITVQEVDGSPSGAIDTLVFPNTTVSIVGTTATYTPTGGGGGLLYWVESKDITNPPNGTYSVSAFTPIPFGTSLIDADAAIVPKGAGALLGAVPDNTAVGGNKRGQYTVDLQLARGSATSVNEQNYAAMIGGSNCRLYSGNYSGMVGGSSHDIQGSNVGVVGGGANTVGASGANSGMLAGGSNTSNGPNNAALGGYFLTLGSAGYSIASGYLCSATGFASKVHGYISNATADYSSAQGMWAETRALKGCRAYSNDNGNGAGMHQRRDVELMCATTNATPTAFTTNGAAASTSNIICIPSTHSYRVTGEMACATNAGATTGRHFEVMLKNVGGVVSIPGAAVIGAANGDAAIAAATVSFAADNVNFGLTINAVGIAATTLRWTITATVTEVGRP